ncbi:MAG: hypothetical protein Q7J25_14600 [Vicinamibacterales bacterium]|nr:hypothetical protein [Vicinamibacterales bacterium]
MRHRGPVADLGVRAEGLALAEVLAAQAGSGAEAAEVVAAAVAGLVPRAVREKGDAVPRWARCTASATW